MHLTTRRRLLAGVGAFASLGPGSAIPQARRARIARVGILGASTAEGYASRWAALREGLRARGWVEGRTVEFVGRYADDRLDRLPALAAELVRLDVDVIVTHGIPGTRAAKAATPSIPIVMAAVTDPVDAGLVRSMSRPDANVTGMTFLAAELAAKRLDVLRDLVPGIVRVGTLLNAQNPAYSGAMVDAMRGQAGALGVQVRSLAVRTIAEVDGAIATLARERVEGFVVIEEATFNANLGIFAAATREVRMPSIGPRDYAQAGGVVGYGADFSALFSRAAHFVDRILRGDAPATLPIERATAFDLVVNPRAARAIGLGVPSAILQRATEVLPA